MASSSLSRIELYARRRARSASALLFFAATALVSLHHLFPDLLTWLPHDFQVAVIIAVAGLLVDRVLAIHDIVSSGPITVYPRRDAAYNQLFELIKEFGAKKIDLIQFSGATAIPLLRRVAELKRPVKVRMYLVNESQAEQYDRDYGKNYHVGRIRTCLNDLWLISKDYDNFKYESFCYSTNAGVSVVVVDDVVVSLGWYTCFPDEHDCTLIRVRGHDVPAINSMPYANPSLLEFARSQIEKIQKCSIPVTAEAAKTVCPDLFTETHAPE